MDNELFNCIWKDQPRYIRLSFAEALTKSTKEDFRCFQFKYIGVSINRRLFIRMVKIHKTRNGVGMETTEWQ